MVSFTTVYTDRWSGCCDSMLKSSAHVCSVSGNPTNVTKIVVMAISAPMATFSTCWTYNSVFRWFSRLCSRTFTWWCSRVRFQCLVPSFSSSWAFIIYRCSGGSIGGSIAFWWILVISVLIVDWGSPGWSSGLWCMCRCCRGPCGTLSAGPEGWPWALLSFWCLSPLRMVFSLLPSLDNDCCCCYGCVDMLPTFGGMNLPWTCLLVIDSSGLYEASPRGSWWASFRLAASSCVCPCCVICWTLLSLGVDVGALPFVPWSTGVCGFSTLNVIGLIFSHWIPCHSVWKTLI